MKTTFSPDQANDTQHPNRQPGWSWRQVARTTVRGVGALLVRLGTREFEPSTRVVRSDTTSQFLVRLGARLDQASLRNQYE